MSLCLQSLKDYKDEILKAEIGALLFNLGKTHIGFWKEKNGKVYFNVDDENFRNIFGFKLFSGYRKYYEKDENLNKSPFEYELEKYGLKDFIFSKQIKFPFDIDGKSEIKWVSFFKGNALEDNEDGKKFIQNIFFKGCENINSGIDKGSPNKQLEPPLWLSNAFGSFKEKIKEHNFDQIRLCFYANLSSFLSSNGYFQNPDWQKIRNFILKEIKNWYLNLLSDSRFPVNDVSLFDQAYMTTSMFKAVLSQLVMNSSKLNDYQDKPSSIKWRILGIQYDKFKIAEKSLKLASIRKYKEITEEIDKEVKNLLEVEYPIGNEIYRDETGIYFIVGENIGENLDNGLNLAKLNDDFIEIEQKILEIFKEKTDDEFYPAIFLTKASRGLMNLSNLLESTKKNFLKTSWKKKNKDLCLVRTEYGRAIGICPICQKRLIYEKDKEKNNSPIICEICDSRIHHFQVSSWIKNINNETIWTDEIKDKNNRIAYISLKFELKDWLSGELLNTLIRNKESKNINSFLKHITEINNFINSIKSLINNLNISDDVKSNIGKFLQKDTKLILGLNKFIQNLIIKDIFDIELRKISSDDDIFKFILSKNNFDKNINIKKLEENINKIQEVINNKLNNLNYSDIDDDTRNFLENFKNIYYQIKPYLLNLIAKLHNIENDLNIFYELYPEALKGIRKENENLNDFFKQIFFDQIIGTKWEDWIKQIPLNSKINWQDEKIEWEKFTDENDLALDILSTLLLQFLLRKNPSPARLKRIWESTQEFFENIHKNLDEILNLPEWRKKRLVWEVNFDEDNKLDKSRELEGAGLLFWAEKIGDKAKIYLISSIEDFIEKFVDKENKDLLLEKLNSENVNLNEIKHYLNEFEILLKRYFESKNKGEGEVLIILTKDTLSEIHSYKPYSLITDTSPKNYQIIIPASFLPNFMDEVIKRYNENFKYVYGKLPIHIGIVVSDYKKPVYVNLKALRNIRRDVNSDKLWVEKNINDFCQLQRQKLSYEKEEERNNNTENYYALYFNNPDRKDYQFFIKSDNNWKYWISTIDKFPSDSKIKMIPNTFDFEFMDTNTRRNDIYYESSDKGYKRAVKIKSNRPYEIEIYWNKFKKFKDLFKNKANTAKMHKLVGLFYEKLQNYDDRYKPLLASAIINILELKKNQDLKENIEQIFDLNRDNDIQRELITNLNEEKLKLFLDMFEFWHTALKEI